MKFRINFFQVVIFVLIIVGMIGYFADTSGAQEKAETDVSKINKVDFPVKYCPCDSSCYTDEVTNLKCDDKFAQFDSIGLPDPNHTLLLGITNSNQQFPMEQPYNAANRNSPRIYLDPKIDDFHVFTDAGAVGIAINGVPLFDPSTQGERHPVSGRRPHTLDVGELDECGGHAGRGDDYHYHIAPKCLIVEMGRDKIENQKLPIGYAKDGFSIHALGWFDSANDIEDKLDQCRGVIDSEGKYFYNMKSTKKWDILNCYSGEPQKTGPRGSILRHDKNGDPLSGGQGFKGMIPIKFRIDKYYTQEHEGELCHFALGEVSKENLLLENGNILRNYQKMGNIFYCNSGCYGHFFESEKRAPGGRITQYDLITSNCPGSLTLGDIDLFED